MRISNSRDESGVGWLRTRVSKFLGDACANLADPETSEIRIILIIYYAEESPWRAQKVSIKNISWDSRVSDLMSSPLGLEKWLSR